MKKSVIALLHIGFWLCYLILIIIVSAVHYAKAGDTVMQEALILNAFKNLFFFALLPSAISFYLYYLFLFPRYLQQRKFILSVVIGLVLSIAAAITGYLLLRYNIDTGKCRDMDNSGESTAMGVIIFMTFIDTVTGIVALVIRGFITWFEEMKLKEELKQKNHETEMALVKAQLDPHFLFNTLNNIDVLILKDATLASDYLNKLSDILRFMLYETKTDTIVLSKEIEYIEKYIELQKIRTSNANYVNFSVTGEIAKKMVAPMVFIPFIENAFKHTNNKKIDHAINISIKITDKNIVFLCENKYNPFLKKEQDQESNGLGNELIQKRLHLIYPQKHQLEVSNQNELYSVRLTINHA
jgi:two-component system, LytTR family, sensor kinase